MRRIIFASIFILIIIGANYLFFSFLLPKTKIWIINKIEQISQENYAIKVEPQKIYFSFFPIGIILDKVNLTPQTQNHKIKNYKKYLEEVKIKQIAIYLDFFALLFGKLNIAKIDITKSTIKLNLNKYDNQNNKNSKKTKNINNKNLIFFHLNKNKLFSFLKTIPINEIQLKKSLVEINTNTLINNENQKNNTQNNIQKIILNELDILVQKESSQISIKIATPQNIYYLENKKNISLDTKLYFSLNEHSFNISFAQFLINDSNINFNGIIKDIYNPQKKPTLLLNLNGNINLSQLNPIINLIFKSKIPVNNGKIKSQIKVKFTDWENHNINFNILSEELQIDKYSIGKLNLKGQYKNKKFNIDTLNISNNAGEIDANEINNINFKKDELKFSTKLNIKKLFLQQLFLNLNLTEIPVYANLASNLLCQINISKNFNVNCNGKVIGKDLLVKAGVDKKLKIVQLKNFNVQGNVKVDKHKVSYDTEIKIAESSGASKGEIIYKKGFEISFISKLLELKHINHLVNLNLEGKADLQGHVSGNASYANLFIQTKINDFIFNYFELGNINTSIKYRKGILHLDNIRSIAKKQNFQGNLQIDIEQNTIDLDMNINNFKISRVKKAIAHYYNLPTFLKGELKGQIKLWGPLDIYKLNYKSNINISNLYAWEESFDKLFLNIIGKQGNFKIKNFKIIKDKSIIDIKGKGNHKGKIDLNIESNKISFDDYNIVLKYTPYLSGLINFYIDIKGNIKSPLIDFNSTITNVKFGSNKIEDSNLQVKYVEKIFYTDFSFFGDNIIGSGQYSYNNLIPFKFSLDIRQWNYANFFALFNTNKISEDYDGELNISFDLFSKKGNPFESNGKIIIGNFLLKRKNIKLINNKKIEISVKNGMFDFQAFAFGEENNFFKMKMEKDNKNEVLIDIKGKTDLFLVQIFFPFIEELNGFINFSFKWEGGLNKPNILGSVIINESYLKIKNFIHPLENLRIDLIFNTFKVKINSITSNFASGYLFAEGNIELKSLNEILMDINGNVQNINLKFPEGIQTTGKGNFKIAGNWLPYTFKCFYKIEDGLITLEMGKDNKIKGTNYRANLYLPQDIQKVFSPIILDIQVDFFKGIEVKTSNFIGKIKGNLLIKGHPHDPQIKGNINAEKDANLYFRDNVFEVATAKINFLNEADNPEIYITAQTKLKEYDINLLIQGKAQNPEIIFTSTPYLSEQDIISLLAFGFTSDNLDQNVVSADQLIKSSVQLGTAILSQTGINKEIEKRFGVNLQLSYPYDDTKNVAVPKVTLAKKLASDLNASASRTFEDQPKYDIRLEYQINRNLSAVGSWESKEEEQQALSNTEDNTSSIFGLDLEYKVEFK